MENIRGKFHDVIINSSEVMKGGGIRPPPPPNHRNLQKSPTLIVLLYRKNITCLSSFYHTLADIMQLGTVHVLFG